MTEKFCPTGVNSEVNKRLLNVLSLDVGMQTSTASTTAFLLCQGLPALPVSALPTNHAGMNCI